MGFISRPPGLTWPVSTIRARAGRCREGGLSPTDERVRGHVTEVTQALWKSSEWSPCHPHVQYIEIIQTLTPTSTRLARQVSCLPGLAQSMSGSGRRQTARSTLLMHVVHLGRLKPPRKAAGHMHLLTVPSHDGADMRFRQDVQALLASSGDR